MKLTYKIITGAAAALSLAAAGLVYAQQGGGIGGYGMAGAMGGGVGMGYGMAGGMSGIDGGAMAASRLADLKAELKITPAQEATWLAFENLTKQPDAGTDAQPAAGGDQHRLRGSAQCNDGTARCQPDSPRGRREGLVCGADAGTKGHRGPAPECHGWPPHRA